ncbi:MAG: hypothetical protein ACK501_09435 [Planctomycetota bacterium]
MKICLLALFAGATLLLGSSCSNAPSTSSTPATSTAAATTAPSLSAELQATKVNNLAMPMAGVLTAGQPTEEQLAQLAKLGVTRIVCLRPASEAGTGWEEAKAGALGVQFVRLPIAGADDLTPAAAEKLATELAAANGQTTLVCCGSSNRVGALLAMKAFYVDKQSKEQALTLGKAAGLTKMLPVVEAKLK